MADFVVILQIEQMQSSLTAIEFITLLLRRIYVFEFFNRLAN